jgi:hypothetical protein
MDPSLLSSSSDDPESMLAGARGRFKLNKKLELTVLSVGTFTFVYQLFCLSSTHPPKHPPRVKKIFVTVLLSCVAEGTSI